MVESKETASGAHGGAELQAIKLKLLERIDELQRTIDEVLDTPTDDPVIQWAELKCLHAQCDGIVYALEVMYEE